MFTEWIGEHSHFFEVSVHWFSSPANLHNVHILSGPCPTGLPLREAHAMPCLAKWMNFRGGKLQRARGVKCRLEFFRKFIHFFRARASLLGFQGLKTPKFANVDFFRCERFVSPIFSIFCSWAQCMWKIMSSKILKDISVLPAQHRPLHLASVKFPEYSYLQDIIDIGRGLWKEGDKNGDPRNITTVAPSPSWVGCACPSVSWLCQKSNKHGNEDESGKPDQFWELWILWDKTVIAAKITGKANLLWDY